MNIPDPISTFYTTYVSPTLERPLTPDLVSTLKLMITSKNDIQITGDRQKGTTTMVLLFAVYYAMFNENKRLLLICPNHQWVQRVCKQVHELHSKLPSEAVSALLRINMTNGSITFDSGSSIHCMVARDIINKTRGMSIDCISVLIEGYDPITFAEARVVRNSFHNRPRVISGGILFSDAEDITIDISDM
jgi:hypothetical protein